VQLSGIEPLIGHLKQDNRMIRNYLSGTQGDAINVLLAAAGFNMRKMLRRIRKKALILWQYLARTIYQYLNIKISEQKNQWVFSGLTK